MKTFFLDGTVYGVTTGFGEFSNVRIDQLERDRILYKDIQTALELVRNDAVLNCVERKIGSLDL